MTSIRRKRLAPSRLNPVDEIVVEKTSMKRPAHQPTPGLLAVRFNQLAPLSDHERGVLRLIEERSRHSHNPDTRLLAQGREPRAPHFVLTGWACRMRELADGRRQIINILLPGDAIGLRRQGRFLAPAHVLALTSMRTIEAPEIAIAWRDRERVPGLAAALDLAVAEEEFFLMGQIMRLGRQTAYERVAHLFVELDYRLSARGLANSNSFPLPLTQEMLADVTGLSVVHVNRTLQQMRREGFIELARGRLTLLNREALRKAGEFVAPALSAPRDEPASQKVAATAMHTSEATA
jgi:CRP-like cAMP-binding protein